MICTYIPLSLAEAYYCQGWELCWIGHHSRHSLLAFREPSPAPGQGGPDTAAFVASLALKRLVGIRKPRVVRRPAAAHHLRGQVPLAGKATPDGSVVPVDGFDPACDPVVAYEGPEDFCAGRPQRVPELNRRDAVEADVVPIDPQRIAIYHGRLTGNHPTRHDGG